MTSSLVRHRPLYFAAACGIAATVAGVAWPIAPAMAQNAETVAADPAAAPPALKPSTSETPAKKAAVKPAAAKPPAAKPDTEGGTEPGAKTASRAPSSGNEQSIVALVNDEPITGYEIQQRAVMLGGGDLQRRAADNFKAMIKSPKTTERLKAILNETIKSNEGKSKDQIIAIFEERKKQFGLGMQKQALESARSSLQPGAKKSALEELIDERLKLQEAKRLGVVIGDEEVTRVIGGIAERNKMTEAQLAAQLGGSLEPMKTRVRSTLSWNDVVRRRFGSQISITSKEVDKFVATGTGTSEDQVELRVQRIRIAMPVKIDQAVVAQRVQDAEKIRAKFTGCKTSGGIATGVAGAKFEEIGLRKPSAFSEPTRSLLLNAKDGEMLPPSVGDGGVELWIVCGREVLKAEDQKRTQAEGELKQKEFELLAKRHLKDLRQDAHIEYR